MTIADILTFFGNIFQQVLADIVYSIAVGLAFAMKMLLYVFTLIPIPIPSPQTFVQLAIDVQSLNLVLPVKEVFVIMFWTVSIMMSWALLRMVLWIAGVFRPSINKLF